MKYAPRPGPKHKQRGTTLLGLVIGLVLGLGVALAVAVYVTKVPMPFTNKNQTRTPEQDAAELRKNQNWDPNALLQGKPKAAASAASAVPAPDTAPVPPESPPAPAPVQGPAGASTTPAQGLTPPPGYPAAPSPPAVFAPGAGAPPAAVPASRASAVVVTSGPFQYFVQAGAFRSPQEAEAQRAKLSLMGLEARVSEREQAGRTVYRVRIGPFDRKEDAERGKARLDASGTESALVQVPR
jgi:cell division protein FtsN